jgi:predicted metalloprotease
MKKQIWLLLICLSIAFTTGNSQQNSGLTLKWDESLAASITPEDYERMLKMDVTDQHIAFVEQVVENSYPAINQVAQEYVTKAGVKFETPTIGYYGYQNKNAPSCVGKIALENAYYCFLTNEISYDILWLARVSKFVREVTATEGTFAVIAVMGHEMGHAADYRYTRLVKEGIGSKAWGILYQLSLERNADCFAGSVVQRLVQDLTIEEQQTAVIEGMAALYAIQGNYSDRNYPPGAERMKIFRNGFEQGSASCFTK